MKKIILLALSCLVGGIMMGLSLNAYAETSDLIPLQDGKHYAQFSIDNVHVYEKDYYKVILVDVHIKVKDLALEDGAMINQVILTNDNGKTYGYDASGEDCKTEEKPIGFSSGLPIISGKEGGIGKFTACYMVEKEFNNFKVSYEYYELFTANLRLYQIGSIDLTNINGQVPTSASNPSTSNPSITNIFEELMNWLKQIFHFMILR